jgi:uncharacterized membrane protein YeaQ/YmgE (transglycosylase-associated protein family)
MDIVLWLVLGALAGWIATIITGTDAEQGWLGNIVTGIIGAFVGGLVLKLFGAEGVSGFNLPSLLTAILGAVILISLLRGFRRSSLY